MPSILTLDLSRKCTGWAAWRDGQEKPRGGTIKLPKPEDFMSDDVSASRKMGVITNELERLLMPISSMVSADQWVYENPLIAIHRPDDGRPGGVNIVEIKRTLGLSIIVDHLAAKHGIPCSGVNRGTVAKHFTSVGNGKSADLKARCIVHCQAKGWNVTDDNIADALAIMSYWTFTNGIETPWDNKPALGPLFTAAATASVQRKSR